MGTLECLRPLGRLAKQVEEENDDEENDEGSTVQCGGAGQTFSDSHSPHALPAPHPPAGTHLAESEPQSVRSQPAERGDRASGRAVSPPQQSTFRVTHGHDSLQVHQRRDMPHPVFVTASSDLSPISPLIKPTHLS